MRNKHSHFPGQEAQEEEKQWHSLASTTPPAMDWSRKGHNTLEKGDMLSSRTIRSLAKLVLAAEVHILSYVGTGKMKKRTLDLIPQPVMAKITTYKTCWLQTGLGGKVDIACGMHAGLVHL